jgi:aldose 1-epimerase
MSPADLLISFSDSENQHKKRDKHTAHKQMSDTAVTAWGKDDQGKEVARITFQSLDGLCRCSMITFGATIQSFEHRKSKGEPWAEMCLGFDDLESYVKGAGHLGATCGRFANRIGNATFPPAYLGISSGGGGGGAAPSLPANSNGKHTLHGGPTGYSRRTWDAFEPLFATVKVGEGAGDDATTTTVCVGVTMRLHSPHGDNGFPGALDVVATYRFDERDHALVIDLRATNVSADGAPTICSLTNHAYWNLSGAPSAPSTKIPQIVDHTLYAPNAKFYLPVADGFAIPTGEIRLVAGTALDFASAERRIGDRIDDALLAPGEPGRVGYDHCLVLAGAGAGSIHAMKHAATLACGDRRMTVETTAPAVQCYSGNFLANDQRGHGGAAFGYRAGLCLETQFFPDSPNQPHFPIVAVRHGETWRSVTRHTFA